MDKLMGHAVAITLAGKNKETDNTDIITCLFSVGVSDEELAMSDCMQDEEVQGYLSKGFKLVSKSIISITTKHE